VIGSNIGAIPEFIAQGQTGELFAPGNADALARMMIRLAGALDQLPGLADSSRALAELYTVERMADAYEAHYRDMAVPQPFMAMAS